MKKLILLIGITLIGFVCVGQVDSAYYKFTTEYQDGRVEHTEGWVGIMPLMELKNYQSVLIEDNSLSVDGKRLITLDDLLKYSDECYRDSTTIAEMRQIYVTNDHIDSGGNWIGGIRWESYYPRRQPTFTGFIEWMKKK